mgnify:CR=1 FL=1
MKRKSQYEKYIAVKRKYEQKVFALAEKYGKELQKKLGVDVEIDKSIFGESLYLILYMDKKRFQAGSFETYFYSDGIHLSEYLFNKEYG